MSLGEFLRSRRARLQPEDVGLSPGVRHRRVAGLRREELAPLAGLSVGYYTRLEQGQGPNVSAEVLDSLARVLRLDGDERAHLHRLARAAGRPGEPGPELLRPGIRRMVESYTGVPAWAVGRRADVLAWNRPAHALFTPHLDFDAPDREPRPNFARMDFLDPRSRDLYVDWEQKARDDIAYLQVSLGRFPGDRGLRELIDELRAGSAEFRAMWAEHPVSNCASISRGYRHPELGVLTLTSELLRTPDDEGQGVVLFQPEPGSAGLLDRLTQAQWQDHAQ
ncbi:helix-turn-helix transcriptional regulator [Nonomuraea jiangxiensis]|uniref:Helix-turn-helix domain-containing protein n=1 Tax=Nonomuraea jiangxiensis TaxID=633440 RepID=A0A1G8LQQ8_9ACTN|nr:helix-turn-helix transcriptional regulator [Nonomuraea jiangxiensis]SDI57945.1 Helix-turn-helix domain-containing protein [Nonomuraea jiangxiensis]